MMPRKVFSRKLLQRLDKVDQEQLERLLSRLVEEKDLIDLAFENISEGVLVTDAINRILLTNVAFRDLMGVGDDLLIGKAVEDVVQDDALLSRFQDVATSDQDREIRVTRPRERWVEVRSIALGEGRNGLLGKLHLLRDVTERRQKQATQIREQRLASLGALAAGLAHEIRNPLNALSIHAQLARREVRSTPEPGSERLTQELDIISEAVESLETIVRQFLNAAKPRRLDRRARDLHAVIDTSLALLLPVLDAKGIEVAKSYDSSVPPLQIDAVQMQEVVMNLVQNAVQAMPQRGRLSIRTSQGKDGIIRIEFQDNGVGIPDRDLPRVFDPYFTTKEDGTGLGLFLVHRIVSDHCGIVEVDSELGKGTKVSLLLPRDLCEARFLPESPISLPSPGGHPS